MPLAVVAEYAQIGLPELEMQLPLHSITPEDAAVLHMTVSAAVTNGLVNAEGDGAGAGAGAGPGAGAGAGAGAGQELIEYELLDNVRAPYCVHAPPSGQVLEHDCEPPDVVCMYVQICLPVLETQLPLHRSEPEDGAVLHETVSTGVTKLLGYAEGADGDDVGACEEKIEDNN